MSEAFCGFGPSIEASRQWADAKRLAELKADTGKCLVDGRTWAVESDDVLPGFEVEGVKRPARRRQVLTCMCILVEGQKGIPHDDYEW